MCGIVGYFSPKVKVDTAREVCILLNEIKHRGPDDEGYAFIDKTNNTVQNCVGNSSVEATRRQFQHIDNCAVIPHNIAFGHRRYSIIDLSEKAHQPFWDEEGKACVIFNGEIYNYLELRKELNLLGCKFETNSDTEVLLKAYLHWGCDCFSKFNGQWALSIYDRRTKELLFSRDRMGKVPLYYSICGDVLYWFSEIKSILKLKGSGRFKINEISLRDYLIIGWKDFGNYTFWENINIFDAASIAKVDERLTITQEKFWDVPNNRFHEDRISFESAKEKMLSLLKNALEIRKRADVPYAFSLSGGMDSSSLVALNANFVKEKFSVYCVRFNEPRWNEEPFASKIANRYKHIIDYSVLKPQKLDFWGKVNDFVYLEEEPFHSPNLFTSYTLWKLIRQRDCKVVIEGVGGDELLAGYHGDYFPFFLYYLLKTKQYYFFLKELFLSTEQSKLAYPKILFNKFFLKKIKRALGLRCGRKTQDHFYTHSISGDYVPSLPPEDFAVRMRANMKEWKMNYWLRSENKTSFGVPIETRQPFLDYRLIDFVFTLPPTYLIRNGWTKFILRENVKDILPKEVVWRGKKMGFPFPIKEWLRSSKMLIVLNLEKSQCPYLNIPRIVHDFDSMAKNDPQRLWRYTSTALWWQKMIKNEDIIV